MRLTNKKVMIVLAMFVFMMAVGNVFAEVVKTHSFDIGPEISHITYKEPGFMREKGVMYGVAGAYTYHNKIMLKAEGRGAYGQVDYKNSGTLDDIDDYILETRGLIGYDFGGTDLSFSGLGNTVITPFFGFGYRYLNDDTSGKVSSTGLLGYERESNYFYSPLGVEIMTQAEDGWSMGAAFEYDLFWQGVQKSHLSDTGLGYNDVSNNQEEGYGLRGSLIFKMKGETVNVIIQPFIRYWNIEKSDNSNLIYAGAIVGYGYEPKNNSTEFGCRLAIEF